MQTNLGLHRRQMDAFLSKASEILYGGAAGGGKSHLARVLAFAICLAVPGVQVYIFRRIYAELWSEHMEGPTSFPAMLADWVLAGLCKIVDNEVRFYNGSRIKLCHAQHEKDVNSYLSAEIHVLIIGELTTFTASMYRKLRARCRLGSLKVPSDCRWRLPLILCNSNPGGVGHNWVKAAWIDGSRPMEMRTMPPAEGGMVRQFIPAKLRDNPSMEADYANKLEGLGNPALVRAMLDGDWNIVAGGMFDDLWREDQHVREVAAIPLGWRIDRCFDWGSSKPFAVLWTAEADGESSAGGWCPPRGSLYVVGEWYGWNGQPNEGLRLIDGEIARGIVERERTAGWKVNPGPADSSIFAVDNGRCIADEMARGGARFLPCQKGAGSRVNGWQAIRRMLAESGKPRPEGPGLWVSPACRHLIRTLPVLPRDQTKPDDVDTESEDHAADALRYRVSQPKPGKAGMVG